MTQQLNRASSAPIEEPLPPPHPHYTLATLGVLGVVAALLALALGVGAIAITAGRDSVDDGIVSEKVDAFLADAGVAADAPTGERSAVVGDVLPAIVPKGELGLIADGEVNVAIAPEMPPPSGRTTPAVVEVHFEVVENVSTIDPVTGIRFETWGYRLLDGPDSIVVGTPGPVIRARVGDVLRFTITNPGSNANPHNVDFHAVTGQGGGAEATTVAPGETRTIEARLLYPGFFMYHCAYGDIPAHISHGMFGGILVDPDTPLNPVDHEWYMVQSEYYTTGEEPGVVEFDRAAVTDENPTFVVFNGTRGALTGDNALQMKVGERARIYFVNAGLNLDSNFHAIGSHWDVVYPEAALLSEPIRGSQTTLIPAGGGTVVELIAQVPSTLVLVDHALSRAVDKGAIGQIVISGEPNPEIFEDMTPSGDPTDTTGGHDTTPPAAEDEPVSIVAGAFNAQPLDAADEFADDEDPPDYAPNVLTIPMGTAVTWTNDDSQIHTVTDVGGAFDSGFLDPGAVFSFTFTEAGEYEYFCLPHPWMRAQVIVTQ
ncbi:MAG: plastocyanin/azurin family copper-binding protein [Acidimicrobiia bacterium]